MLIDGLDEAADPRALTRGLLRPLLEHAGAGLRLLVGTRPFLLDDLGLDRGSALDLDAPHYADLHALRTYAVRGLIEAEPHGIYTTTEPPVIRAVAAAVADQATPSFLVARIVSATLAAEHTIPDPADQAWRASLPAMPGEAMGRDLDSRLRTRADAARDLLQPLAFAQGQGLPWEDLWAPIASALAGATYTDADLLWLRRTAGSYVVEAAEDGRSAYRLYHQALAEYLTHGHDPATVHTTFVHVLRARVPVGADGYRDWARAHPYTLRHLATHAALAGLIDEVITDMDYLVHAEPAPLQTALHQTRSDDGLLTRAIYRWSAAHHQHMPSARRRQILAFDAARFDATRQHHQLNRTLAWRTRWATDQLTHTAHRATLNGHASPVDAVACTEFGGRPVAVTGGRDGTVRVWDLDTGTEHLVLPGHTPAVRAVACTQLGARPVAVTGGLDRRVRVWYLDTGTEHLVLTSHTGSVLAVACTELGGRPVAVTASDDGTVRVWYLDTGTEHLVLTGHTGWVWAVACTKLGGRPVAVTGGLDRTVRVWYLDTGTEHLVLTGHTGSVFAVACTQLGARPVAVTGGRDDQTVRVWYLDTGTEHLVLTGHTGWVLAVACTQLGGRPVAVTAGDDRTVRVWYLDTGTEHLVLPGHTGWVRAVACTQLGGRPVALTGGHNGTVRVWNLDEAGWRSVPSLGGELVASPSADTPDMPTGVDSAQNGETMTDRERPPIRRTWSVRAVACTQLARRPVAVTAGDDGTVRVWDLDTGTEHLVLTGHTGWVRAVACTQLGGRPVAVTAGDDRTVRVWDLDTGTEHLVLPGHTGSVRAVACTQLGARPVAVTAGHNRTVRVWNLDTGTEHLVLTGHTGSVLAVACTQLGARPVAVTVGDDGTVRVWDLDTGTEHLVLPGHTGSVFAVACTQLGGRPVAVTGGLDRTVRVWDLDTGTEHLVLTGHTGWVGAVACTELGGRPVAVTGSNDGTVQVWDLATMMTIAVLDCPGLISVVSVGPGGEIVVVVDDDIAVFEYQPPSVAARH
ncbi:WD40 repeat domain-containing protein [Nocardia asteroides]|uniref:WD40 repeat domain-containing protein n=1 Tax=Nocardia asteroides TaxID=1824 RepID=UPI001E55AD31|nr:WD40 repeat domain-containing protein [Nocardia asteroides]UGT65225.1 hypothetical protein LTT61_00155 [Nocardia asteroides]